MKRMPTDGTEVDLQTRVRAVLAQLPADQRRVIELTLVAGLTQKAIAVQLNCDEAEVPRLAQLALQSIREALNISIH
jgi:RNA polymerase sigma factor (sigma-70 family)